MEFGEDIDKRTAIAKVEVGQIIISFLSKGYIEYPNVIKLTNKIETKESIFLANEIAWLYSNYEFFRSIVKAPQGRKIYNHLFNLNDNAYQIHKKLKMSRTTVLKWVNLFCNKNLVYINPNVIGCEKLFCLNRDAFPNLSFFIKWMISEKVNKEYQEHQLN